MPTSIHFLKSVHTKRSRTRKATSLTVELLLISAAFSYCVYRYISAIIFAFGFVSMSVKEASFWSLHNKHASRLHNNLRSYSIQCDRKKPEKKRKTPCTGSESVVPCTGLLCVRFNDFQIQEQTRKRQITFILIRFIFTSVFLGTSSV